MIFPKRIDTSIAGRIVDIRKAFNADAYLSAISLALTIPDVCGSRLHPDMYVRERYVAWFDEYIAQAYLDETTLVIGDKLVDPRYYFDGEDCYQLRCAYLHQGANTPDRTKPKTVYNVIQFRVFEGETGSCDHIGSISGGLTDGIFRQVDLDLGKFIRYLDQGVAHFLRDHPDMNADNGSDSYLYAPIQDFKSDINL